MSKSKKTLHLRTKPFDILTDPLDWAIERGMNRHDKYTIHKPLAEASRKLLLSEIESSFWLYMDDHGIEVK